MIFVVNSEENIFFRGSTLALKPRADETQGGRHRESKTGVSSVTPQKGIMSSKNLKKNFLAELFKSHSIATNLVFKISCKKLSVLQCIYVLDRRLNMEFIPDCHQLEYYYLNYHHPLNKYYWSDCTHSIFISRSLSVLLWGRNQFTFDLIHLWVANRIRCHLSHFTVTI